MSLVLVLVIIILRKTSDDSAIWLLIKLAGFTYGPLIALFFFGILTKRKLLDQYVPIICVSITFILALIWGVHTIHALEPKSFSGMIENACELAKKEGIVKKGDYVVVTAGAPIGVSGSTNNLRIAKIN